MIYTQIEYAILLLAVWLCYSLFRGRSIRLHLLVAASLLFYGWAGPFDLSIFVAVITFSYLTMVLADRYPRYRGSFIAVGIIVLTLHLLVWKYLPWVARGMGRELLIPLPLGISFFTLQGIGYLIDFRRGDIPRMTFREYLLFKSFFPQLIAGPIIRGADMWDFLKKMPTARLNMIIEGLFLIGIGLTKKLIIADFLGIFVDTIYSNPARLDRATLALGAVGFYIQIWGDFSGYTDIGRGSALLFGLRLPENFYSTLYSDGGVDWSRRWHSTLQTWVRDYMYFPLSEFLIRRRPAFVRAEEKFNLVCRIFSRYFSAMMVALWHGAALNFFVWGLALWALATAETLLQMLGFFGKNRSPLVRCIYIVCLLPVFFLTGVIFRCPSLEILGDYLSGLFGPNVGRNSFIELASPIYWRVGLAFLIDGIMYFNLRTKRYVILSWLWSRVAPMVERFPRLSVALAGVASASIIVCALAFRSSDSLSGFIYFRF